MPQGCFKEEHTKEEVGVAESKSAEEKGKDEDSKDVRGLGDPREGSPGDTQGRGCPPKRELGERERERGHLIIW